MKDPFKYPTHFKLPEPAEGVVSENFHTKWIPSWLQLMRDIIGKDGVIGVEIGSLHGCSAVWSLEHVLYGKNSFLYCIDINESEYLKRNLAPYNNVKFLQGKSYDVLRSLTHNGLNAGFADYVYIDGSHLAADVLTDSVLGFALLKPGGLIMWDDVGWGIHTSDETQKPMLGVNCFLTGFKKYYEIIASGWQVYAKKLDYQHDYDEAKANYELDGGRI